MSDLAAAQVILYGYVQGVFFRAFASRQAKELGITGYVRNLPDGTVEVRTEGERKQLEDLIGRLRVGPSAASIERVATKWSEYTGSYPAFGIRY